MEWLPFRIFKVIRELAKMNNQSIPVSVIIPTYSRNDTLIRAINSVLNQTYQNLEIIVVDDNPVESEWRICTEKLMGRYIDNPKIKYIKNKENLGGAGARNEGIKASSSEYIAFLDDDDEYFKERIEKQMDFFLNHASDKTALVFCDAVMTGDNGVFVCYLKPRYKGCCLYEAMKDNCLAPTSQWMAKKSALIDVGMFSIVPCKQDSTLILKLLSKGFEVGCVPIVLSRYRNIVDPRRISCSGNTNIKGELLYRKECRKLYGNLSRSQIKEVEYSFNSILYHLYSDNKIYSKKNKYRKAMMKAFPFRSVIIFAHDRVSLLKWKIIASQREVK